MKNMNNVMTVRLPEEDVQLINQFATAYKKDKSTAVRELVEMGRLYFALQQYIKAKISLGKAAEISGVTISEIMDLMIELGIKNKLEINDYLESVKTAKKIF